MIVYPRIMQTKKLIDRIRALRQHLGWTQEQLAVRAGLHRNTIATLETQYPGGTSIATYDAIAQALGWQLDELVSDRFELPTKEGP